MNNILKADICIVGAGISGSSLACALASHPLTSSLRIFIIDSNNILNLQTNKIQYSNRVLSITPTSQIFLERIGCWKNLNHERIHSFQNMNVWDSNGSGKISFTSELINNDRIATIVENVNLTSACINRMQEFPKNIQVYDNKTIDSIDRNDINYPVVSLNDGKKIESKLLIGADGGNSIVRKFANIDSLGWDYNQMGVVANLELQSMDINNTAWQRFLPTGPIALLPLGMGKSSLVWSLPTALAQKIVKMNNSSFTHLLNGALNNPFIDLEYIFSHISKQGDVEIDIKNELDWGRERSDKSGEFQPPEILNTSDLAAFPLKLRNSTYYGTERVALIGDAGHSIHPLAGQGLNLGISDVERLTRALVDGVSTGQDIGTELVIKEYTRERYLDNLGMLMGVDAISKIFGNKYLGSVRSVGMNALDNIPMAKRMMMKFAR